MRVIDGNLIAVAAEVLICMGKSVSHTATLRRICCALKKKSDCMKSSRKYKKRSDSTLHNHIYLYCLYNRDTFMEVAFLCR
jgi:hypothetical protein